MPSTSITNGDTEELVTLGWLDVVSINPSGGDVRVSKTRRHANSGDLIQDGDRSQHIGLDRGGNESVYAYADGANVDVEYATQGFLSLFQPRRDHEVNITGSDVNVPIDVAAASATLDTSITSASATVDTNIASAGATVDTSLQSAAATVDMDIVAQTISNLGIDIQAQTLTELTQDQSRRSAEGVTEVNGDQTATISAGGSQTTTVTANTNEVWELRGFYFEWTSDSDWSGNVGENVGVTVETANQGIELGYGESNQTASGDTWYYRSGSWSSNWNLTRDDILRGHKIDDTNGINVVVAPESTAMDNTRIIRFEFEQVQA